MAAVFTTIKELLVHSLGQGTGMPGLTPEWGAFLAQACAVCLHQSGHTSGVELRVQNLYICSINLRWNAVTAQMEASWADPDEATEYGAVCIAALIVKELTPYKFIRRSYKGPKQGFEYWIGDSTDPGFQNNARLEVSGIRKGNNNIIKARVKQKHEQTKRSDGTLPAYIVVVEFSKPITDVSQRCCN